jgi:DNA repair exonuclease SbcCD ATPase subunit
MTSEKKGLSAQERKQQILDQFKGWIEEREAADDWSKYTFRTGDKLNRSEIAEELSFARSAWTSNKELQNKLLELEKTLRNEGKLQQLKEKDVAAVKAESDRTSRTLGKSQSRVKNLEQQLAAVTAERDDLRRRVDRLEFLEHHMATNGRVAH